MDGAAIFWGFTASFVMSQKMLRLISKHERLNVDVTIRSAKTGIESSFFELHRLDPDGLCSQDLTGLLDRLLFIGPDKQLVVGLGKIRLIFRGRYIFISGNHGHIFAY